MIDQLICLSLKKFQLDYHPHHLVVHKVQLLALPMTKVNITKRREIHSYCFQHLFDLNFIYYLNAYIFKTFVGLDRASEYSKSNRLNYSSTRVSDNLYSSILDRNDSRLALEVNRLQQQVSSKELENADIAAKLRASRHKIDHLESQIRHYQDSENLANQRDAKSKMIEKQLNSQVCQF